jgi:hypothetical protein
MRAMCPSGPSPPSENCDSGRPIASRQCPVTWLGVWVSPASVSPAPVSLPAWLIAVRPGRTPGQPGRCSRTFVCSLLSPSPAGPPNGGVRRAPGNQIACRLASGVIRLRLRKLPERRVAPTDRYRDKPVRSRTISLDRKVQGFKSSGVQKFRGSKVQGFNGRVQGFRGSPLAVRSAVQPIRELPFSGSSGAVQGPLNH